MGIYKPCSNDAIRCIQGNCICFYIGSNVGNTRTINKKVCALEVPDTLI